MNESRYELMYIYIDYYTLVSTERKMHMYRELSRPAFCGANSSPMARFVEIIFAKQWTLAKFWSTQRAAMPMATKILITRYKEFFPFQTRKKSRE